MTEIPDDIDLDADARPDPSQVGLAEISKLAQEQIALQDAIAAMEAAIKQQREALMDISRSRLPAAMDAVGMRKFVLSDGSEVHIKDVISASFPSDSAIDKAKGEDRDELLDRRHRCLEWLDGHGGDPLIKTAVIAELGKGAKDLMDELIEIIKGLGIAPQQKLSIHNGSLTKFLKEKLAMAEDIPMDDFKVFIGQESKITAGK